MKKIIGCFAFILLCSVSAFAQGWGGNRGGNDGYYMGPGMMWGDNDSWMGPGMMWGNWHNGDWHKKAKSSLNLTQQQSSQWDNVVQQSSQNQQAVNDSIKYYVSQIRRLQRDHSGRVQQDLNQIKQILTPEQYTQFLEQLVTGNK